VTPRRGLVLTTLLLALAACQSERLPSRVLAARIEAGSPAELVLDLDLRLSERMLEALDHGVPLGLRIDIDARQLAPPRQTLRWQLAQQPLSGQYALTDGASGVVHVYARRALLLAALDHLRMPLAGEVAGTSGAPPTVRVRLDHDLLPGPLRLPALVDPEWQLDARGP
jgi:hypothetical protein